jgi:hypothetical protein
MAPPLDDWSSVTFALDGDTYAAGGVNSSIDVRTLSTSKLVWQLAALKQGQGSDLVVECEVRPGKEMKLGMAQRPSVDRGLTSTLYKKLAAIDPPVVKGPIKFHVTFKIRGGSNSGDWEPISSP